MNRLGLLRNDFHGFIDGVEDRVNKTHEFILKRCKTDDALRNCIEFTDIIYKTIPDIFRGIYPNIEATFEPYLIFFIINRVFLSGIQIKICSIPKHIHD